MNRIQSYPRSAHVSAIGIRLNIDPMIKEWVALLY